MEQQDDQHSPQMFVDIIIPPHAIQQEYGNRRLEYNTGNDQ
jgi:hypothetical protein